jgi:hypothetical protein
MTSRVRALVAVLGLATLAACEDSTFQVATCDEPLAAPMRWW